MKAVPILDLMDRFGRCSPDRHPGLGQGSGQLQRGLPAELYDHPGGSLVLHNIEHVLERHRFEVEPVGGIVVGRYRLGVGVDHDGLVAGLAQSPNSVNGGVVELHSLADSVGPGAEDDHLVASRRGHLILPFIRAVVVGGVGLELRCAGVHRLVDWGASLGESQAAKLVRGSADDRGEVGIAKSDPLNLAPQFLIPPLGLWEGCNLPLGLYDLAQLGHEPGIDPCPLTQELDTLSPPEEL